MGGRKNDNKEKNKNKKEKNDFDDDDSKGRKNKRKEKRKEKRHGQKNWQDSDEFIKHMKEFNEEVSKYGLYIRDVQGDGNCLFRSVADQLEGNESMHVYYRKLSVEQMKKQADFFKNFVFDVEFDSYLNEMSQICTWGGNLEIQALSAALGHNFVLHIKGKPYLVIKGTAVKGIKKRTIHLAYHCEEDIEEHYSSIRNIGDNDKDQPAQQIKNEVLKTLEKQLNKDDAIQDDSDDWESEDNVQIEKNASSKEEKDSTSNPQKKSKQSKVDIAKEKREKTKAKKVTKEEKKESHQKEKTHKKKQKQSEENNENSENDSVKDNEDSQETEDEGEECNGEKTEKMSKEIQKRNKEKEIKEMVKQVAAMNIGASVQPNEEDDDENQKSKMGRNKKCHCGSSKAYKKCCEAKDEASKKQKQKQNKDELDSIKEVVFI